MARGRKRPSMGRLRHRVKILNWLEEPDDDTGIVRTHQPVAEVYAQIKPMKAITSYGWTMSVGQRESPTHTIVIRNPSDIQIDSNFWFYTVTRRAREMYKVLQVQCLEDDERFLECLCAKRTARDVRADPAIQDVPAEEPADQQNQAPKIEMDAPTAAMGVRPELGRFRDP